MAILIPPKYRDIITKENNCNIIRCMAISSLFAIFFQIIISDAIKVRQANATTMFPTYADEISTPTVKKGGPTSRANKLLNIPEVPKPCDVSLT
jgi:hypothetical protein